MSELFTIATYSTVASAEIARNLLAENGITAITNSAQGLNAIYGTWMSGVQLQVQEEDVDRAVDILEAENGLPDEPDHEATVEEPAEETEVDARTLTVADQGDNPYVPPAGASLDDAADPTDEVRERQELENDVTRIYRGAVLSMMWPLLAPYVIWQLIGRIDQVALLSPEGKKRIWWSWALSISITLIAVIVMLAMFLPAFL